MLNYNRAKIIIQEKKAVDAMLYFYGRWTREERVDIKMSSLSIGVEGKKYELVVSPCAINPTISAAASPLHHP